jgi:hypothetical protein
MPHNEDTIRLLRELGVTEENTKHVYYGLLTSFSNRSQKSINNELREMRQVAKLAKREAKDFLVKQGLKADGDFVYNWNQQFMCLEIKLKIAGTIPAKSDEHFLSYEGRQIEIKVLTRNSNNNFGSADIRSIFESKFATAQSFHTHNKIYQNNIRALNNKFELEIVDLMRNFDNISLGEALDRCIQIHQEFICALAAELARADKGNYDYNPSTKMISDSIEILKERENSLLSFIRRPILINCYPQETLDAAKSQWLINVNTPKSDISSASRNLSQLMISNWWRVQNKTVNLETTARECKVVAFSLKDEFDRSSSLAQLSQDEIDRKRELETLRRIIIQDASDMLIEGINSSTFKNIPQKLMVKTAYITLLSPFIDKSTGQSIKDFTPESAHAKTIIENEKAQLDSLQACLAAMEGVTLSFTPKDIEHILKHTGGKINEEQLQAIRIGQKNFSGNFVVNKFLGQNMELYDLWSNHNRKYNNTGLKKLHEHIRNFIDEYADGKHALDLKGFFDSALTESKWEDVKAILEQKKLRIPPGKLHDLITLYISIQDHWHSTSNKSNSRIVNSFIAAANECEIAEILGFKSRITCKSGKDRTGLFIALKEALLSDDQLLIQNTCNALKFFAGKDMNQRNIIGCRGMQISASILNGLYEINGHKLDGYPSEIQDLIHQQLLDRIGKLGKAVYDCNSASFGYDSAVTRYVKEYPPTDRVSPTGLSGSIKQMVDSASALVTKRIAKPSTTTANVVEELPQPAKAIKPITVQEPKPIIIAKRPVIAVTETLTLKPIPAKEQAVKAEEEVPNNFNAIRAKFEKLAEKHPNAPTPAGGKLGERRGSSDKNDRPTNI